jgi:hypothetical protein
MKPGLNKIVGCWAAIFLGVILIKFMADAYGLLITLAAWAGLMVSGLAYYGVAHLLSRKRPK